MCASITEHKSRQSPQIQSREPPLATSAFKGEARLRELEHLADTAHKVRDQAAAELTRGSGATHHIARERIAAAEQMLRKAQSEIVELRAQLAHATPGAPEATITRQDFELAVLLGHNKGRFNQVGGAHAPLELAQDSAHGRPRTTTTKTGTRHSQAYAATAKSSSMGGKRAWTFGVLLVVGLGLGAFGTYAMLNQGVMAGATQVVRDGTVQLIIRLRALLPTTDASGHTTAKAAFSKVEHALPRQPI